MFRSTLLLLIVSMLACPLRCSAHATGSGSEAAATASGHRCCDACHPLPSEQSSPCPDDGCECGSCICRGAVLEKGAELLAADSLCCFVAVLLVPDFDLGVQPAALVHVNDASSHRDIFTNGRAARIAHQSLLI